MFVRRIMAPRLVIVETVRIADWKFATIQVSPAKREAKYGAAARNMFLKTRGSVLVKGMRNSQGPCAGDVPSPEHRHAQDGEDGILHP